MNRWKEALVGQGRSIKEAIQILDKSGLQIVLVVNEATELLGTITDGDVRRGILKGISLENPVIQIMNPKPLTAKTNESRQSLLSVMKARGINAIPLVDDQNKVVGLDTLNSLIGTEKRPNHIVLMAGGLGSRLGELTADCPKPMLKVGGKPLLETILDNLIEHGFEKFYISVNHKAEVIRSYFGDGAKWGVKIEYIQETQRLGTAGALSLIPVEPKESILVMNGDLLTKVNFSQLLEFHINNKASATMCVREYDFQVPYGVVKIDKHRILGIDEKPVQKFFVNAGIYALEPAILKDIPANTFLDMPSLFEKVIQKKEEAVVFPIREYWLDIGQLADYQRANGEYKAIFEE